MSNLANDIYGLLKDGEGFVLATILSHAGSTPRTAGTRMIIRVDGSIIGTIGGGLVEAEVMRDASGVFREKRSLIRNFNLNTKGVAESMDMICGGELTVLLEFMEATRQNTRLFENLLAEMDRGEKCLLVTELSEEESSTYRVVRSLIGSDGSIEGNDMFPVSFSETLFTKFQKERAPVLVTLENRRFLLEPAFVPGTVLLFGAGHVSMQVAALTAMVDFRTVVLDDRAKFANAQRFSMSDEIHVLEDFENAFEGLQIDKDSYVVILTRGHNHDKTVLRQALKTDAGYIGMIGSKRKRSAIYNSLMAEGVSEEDLSRVYSPIGVEIKAETPSEIAVSIVAQLIAVRAE